MTRSSQKKRERFLAEKAAECLGKKWCLGPDRADHNPPDFIVIEGTRQFGLEVCEISTGQQYEAGGSHMKRKESEAQKAVNTLQCKYESKENIPLSVMFVGDMCAKNMDAVFEVLDEMKLSTMKIGDHEIIEVDEGPARLRVFVTRALRANWLSANNRAGAVDCDPVDRIAERIEKKSEKLPRYKECAGLDDIRLLLVADHTMNSGKLLLEEGVTFDLRGFRIMYFFPHPDPVSIFDCADNKV